MSRGREGVLIALPLSNAITNLAGNFFNHVNFAGNFFNHVNLVLLEFENCFIYLVIFMSNLIFCTFISFLNKFIQVLSF